MSKYRSYHTRNLLSWAFNMQILHISIYPDKDFKNLFDFMSQELNTVPKDNAYYLHRTHRALRSSMKLRVPIINWYFIVST